MLDWFTGTLGFDGSRMELGRFIEVDGAGEIVRARPRWETARGSYESGIQVTVTSSSESMRSDAERLNLLCSPMAVRMSGNPSKYFQGHNVVGPPVEQLAPVLRDVVRSLPGHLRPVDADSDDWFALARNRVDITTSCDLGSDQAVHDLLMEAEKRTRSRQGRAMRDGVTVYWQKNSRRWSLKAYCKLCEMEAHPPTVDLVTRGRLNDFAYGLLRLELTLRTPELKPLGTLDESLIWTYVDRLEVSGVGTTERPASFDSLGGQAKLTCEAWVRGTDVRALLSRRTFYRRRKEILDATGLDISLPPPNSLEPHPFLWGEELRALEVRDVPPLIDATVYRPRGPFAKWSRNSRLV